MLARLDAQIESLKTQKAQVQKSPVFMAGFFNAFAGYLKDFTQQTKSVTLVCNPKPTVLNISAGLNTLPGTEIADILTPGSATPRKSELVGYTEDGAAMNFIWRIDHTLTKKINAKFLDLMTQMAGKDSNAPDVVKTKKLCSDMVDAIGDFTVCSVSIDPNAKPFFVANYVLEIKDTNQFNRTIDEFAKIWAGSSLDDIYKSMGIETSFAVKHGVDNYNGVSIDAATLGMKVTDTNLPEANMIDAMYGKGLEYRWAIVNGLWVCKISSDPNAIYKLIDQVKAGPPAQVCSEMQKAMSIIPDVNNEDIVATYNYLRLMKCMQAFAPMPFTIPDISSKSNLVFAGRIDKSSLILDMALPKEHLSEMVMAFQAMMQHQGQQKMQQPGQTPQLVPKEKPRTFTPPADK